MSTKQQQTPQFRGYDEWHTLMCQFESENITVKAFCQQREISESTFYKWRARLRKAGVVSKPSHGVVSQPDVRPESSGFLEIGALHLSQQSGLELRLDLGGGVVLTLLRH